MRYLINNKKLLSVSLTILLFFVTSLILSFLPISEELKPFGNLNAENFPDKFVSAVFSSSDSSTLPWRGLDASDVDSERVSSILTRNVSNTNEKKIVLSSSKRSPSIIRKFSLDSDYHQSYKNLAKKIGARLKDINNFCLKMNGDKCEKRALDSFYYKLDKIRQLKSEKPVKILHYGDSLIAADYITDIARMHFSGHFGSAGRGFLFPDRFNPHVGRRLRTGIASENWQRNSIIEDDPPDYHFGLSGVRFTSKNQGDIIEYSVDNEQYAVIYYLANSNCDSFTVFADDYQIKTLNCFSETAVSKTVRIEIPPEIQKIIIKANSPDVVIFGASFETERGGIIYDSIGLPGAQSKVYSSMDNNDYKNMIKEYNPSLIVYMNGGGDALHLVWGRWKKPQVREYHRKMFKRIRESAPNASCLISTTIDIAKVTVGGSFISRKQIKIVADIQKEEAQKAGCAFFNLYEAMGGKGSVGRWHKQGLISDDMLHPRREGLDLLGQIFSTAILQDYNKHLEKVENNRVYSVIGNMETPSFNTFDNFFNRLNNLKNGAQIKVRIGQFGASHTAAQMFTDTVRKILSEKFDYAGRGYIYPGPAARHFKRDGFILGFEGDYKIISGLEDYSGSAYSLSGDIVRLNPNGIYSLEISEENNKVPSLVDMYYLVKSGMGQATALLNTNQKGMLSTRLDKGALQKISFNLEPGKNTVSIKSLGPGSVDILNWFWEMKKSGFIYDSVGLFTSTGMTPLQWNNGIYTQLLQKRDYDLIVTWWGTNEAKMADLNPEEYYKEFKKTIELLRKKSNGKMIDCIIIGTTDRAYKDNREYYHLTPSTGNVNFVHHKLASDLNCAFWAAHDAMGGPGSIYYWRKTNPVLSNKDHVHLTRKGYEKMGKMFANDLLQSFNTWLDNNVEDKKDK